MSTSVLPLLYTFSSLRLPRLFTLTKLMFKDSSLLLDVMNEHIDVHKPWMLIIDHA